ncbi:GNAT family N-acetyltransferase [Lacticaseibacillus suihuaensis]
MANFLIKPTLVGPRLSLRAFTAADVPRMLEILSQPMVNLYTGALSHWPKAAERFAASAEERQRITDWYATRGQADGRLDWAIVLDAQVIGEVVLNQYDAAANTCNLRVLIADDATGHGSGFEALHLACAYALGPLGLAALTLDAFDFNLRAQHVYHKLGFVDTGRIEGDLMLDGQPRASITMRLDAAAFH